ncbi:hypothetical protein X801_04509 [Opisthorchis viverrini]|uniref:Uncharacterized protein n=1 Tax=Opisthorchis viverrini TaxID=6198 RepID=A0A1S8WYN0_OPIVI|nr:hypothetical protein X801_04509 [Opisthorchis viverrini]
MGTGILPKTTLPTKKYNSTSIDYTLNMFPYCRVQTITTSSRVVTLNLLEDDGSVKARNYQLASPRLASSLYRLVNEVYAFFRCDSVRKEVLSQTRRDILDAISFHHNGDVP